MAAVSRARLLNLMEVQCKIFSTTYNPDGVRMGNKILRQRLKGPTLAKYYPRPTPTVIDLQKEFGKLHLETIDEVELDRQEHLEGVRSRGKGAPKKLKGPPAEKGKK